MLLRALLTAGVLALAAPAFAQTNPQQPTGAQGLMQACGSDIQNFCSGVTPGGGRIASCLRPHLRQLSPECKGQLVEMRARHQQQMQQQQQPQPQPQP
jgi:hypothetical protein